MNSVSRNLFAIVMAVVLALPASVMAGSGDSETWLPSLQADTPQEGFALAVKLSRMSVKTTQPDIDVLKEGRKEYSRDPDSLINASQVVALYFRTIAEANDYWRD